MNLTDTFPSKKHLQHIAFVREYFRTSDSKDKDGSPSYTLLLLKVKVNNLFMSAFIPEAVHSKPKKEKKMQNAIQACRLYCSWATAN